MLAAQIITRRWVRPKLTSGQRTVNICDTFRLAVWHFFVAQTAMESPPAAKFDRTSLVCLQSFPSASVSIWRLLTRSKHQTILSGQDIYPTMRTSTANLQDSCWELVSWKRSFWVIDVWGLFGGHCSAFEISIGRNPTWPRGSVVVVVVDSFSGLVR